MLPGGERGDKANTYIKYTGNISKAWMDVLSHFDAVLSLANEGSDLFLECNEGNLPLPTVGKVDLGVFSMELESLKLEPSGSETRMSTSPLRARSVFSFSMACLVTSSTVDPGVSTGAILLSRSFKTS